MDDCKILDKDSRIKAEKQKLTRLFAKMDTKQKRAVQSLIENAAFMAATLWDLQETMNREGVVSEYQNGEHQCGTKKSPEVEIYNTMIKNYAAVMKQITDMLPETPPPEVGEDELDAHIKNRPD